MQIIIKVAYVSFTRLLEIFFSDINDTFVYAMHPIRQNN